MSRFEAIFKSYTRESLYSATAGESAAARGEEVVMEDECSSGRGTASAAKQDKFSRRQNIDAELFMDTNVMFSSKE